MATSTKIIQTSDNHTTTTTTIPWINSKHYFQKRHKTHLSIRTGFCGCLTTFASWNAQMIQMICTWDISTIILAVYGYVLGIQSCYMSLKFGQYISFILYCYWNDNEENTVIIQQESIQAELEQVKIDQENENEDITIQEYMHTSIPFLIVIPLFIYFLYQSITTTKDQIISSSIHKRNAYRELWLSCFFSPFGAGMRYQLSYHFNKSRLRHSYAYIHAKYLGTFLANIIGSIIAIICMSFIVLIQVTNWNQDILYAIKLGFAGCLSTVSTFIDEFDTLLTFENTKRLENRYAYYYIYGTLFISCLLGVCIYAPLSYAVNFM